MSKGLHNKYFTEEELSTMKMSTIVDLRIQEEKSVEGVKSLCAICFTELILIIAMLFWFSKLTMFIVTVGMLFVGINVLSLYLGYKAYMKLIAQAKKQ